MLYKDTSYMFLNQSYAKQLSGDNFTPMFPRNGYTK